MILPSGLAAVVAAVAANLDTELVTVNTGARVTNIDWWVVSVEWSAFGCDLQKL